MTKKIDLSDLVLTRDTSGTPAAQAVTRMLARKRKLAAYAARAVAKWKKAQA